MNIKITESKQVHARTESFSMESLNLLRDPHFNFLLLVKLEPQSKLRQNSSTSGR